MKLRAVAAVLALAACQPLTAQTTGPEVPDPVTVGPIDCDTGDTLSFTDVNVTGDVILRRGCDLTLTRVRVAGAVVALPQVGAPRQRLHVDGSAIHHGLFVSVVDATGSLYWASEVPVDVKVSNSWVHAVQQQPPDHTHVLGGQGYPTGARFYGNTFVHDGPFNGTATAVVYWWGADTLFVGNNFLYTNGKAAYWTLYVRGRHNTVHNNDIETGLAGYVYPNGISGPPANYSANRDAETGQPVSLP